MDVVKNMETSAAALETKAEGTRTVSREKLFQSLMLQHAAVDIKKRGGDLYSAYPALPGGSRR
jgi:hypothetical protein